MYFSFLKVTPDTHGRQKGRVVKRLVIFLLVIVAVIAGCEIAGWPFLRMPLQNKLASTLQRTDFIGEDFKLRLIGSIRGRTNELRIGPPPTDQPAPAKAKDKPDATDKNPPDPVQANDIEVALPYSTLFKFNNATPDNPPRITSLDVGYLKAYLVRDASGKSNRSMGANQEQQNEDSGGGFPAFDHLVLRKSDIHLDDAKSQVKFDAQVATTEGSANENSTDGAGLKITAKGEYHYQPLTAEATSSGILPLIASPEPSSKIPLTIRVSARNSEFNFKGEAMDVLKLNGVTGHVSLQGPSLSIVGDIFDITLPTTPYFSLSGDLKRMGNDWSMERARLDTGDSHLSGRFNYDADKKTPELKGELSAAPLRLADLAPAFGAPPEQNEGNAEATRHVLPQRSFDIPSLHRMNAHVKLRMKKVNLGNAFSKPLQPLDADLELENGVFSIRNMLARTADGELRGGLTLDANQKIPHWEIDLKWADIDLQKWLAAKNQFANATETLQKTDAGYVSGKLYGNANLTGDGQSTALMLGSLDGSVNLWVRKGEISQLVVEALGLDIAESLGLVVSGDDTLTMRCAIIAMNARKGTLTPDVAIIDTPDTTVFAAGNISLAQERLDLKITAKPRDKSPLTLRSPLRIEGDFANPNVELEKQKIGLKLLGAGIMAALAPLAAIITLIDLGDEEEAGGCKQALQQLKANPE